MGDPTPTATKRHRIHNAFAESQNKRGDRGAILKFLRQAMKPERYLAAPHRYEPLRANVNAALAFVGLAFDDGGTLGTATAVTTLPEAERRARELRADLELRGVHPEILRFCRSELLVDNYFHATLEAVKAMVTSCVPAQACRTTGPRSSIVRSPAIRPCSRSTRSRPRASVTSRRGSPICSRACSGCSATRPRTRRRSTGPCHRSTPRIS